jgi:hypothetical protein
MSDVLILEWSTDLNRDRLVATLVANYLRYMNYNIVEGALQNGMLEIHKHKPKVLLLVNTIGSELGVKISLYAKKCGIIVVSFYGEGVFDVRTVDRDVWGKNFKKDPGIDDYRLVWNLPAYRLIRDNYPELIDTTFTSGSVGADNYLIDTYSDKLFLNRYPKIKLYKKIVGVGCWDFGVFDEEDWRFPRAFKQYNQDVELINLFKRDAVLFNQELLKLVKKCPDVLFLIKEHPQRNRNTKNSSAINGVGKYENVQMISDDASIAETIKCCDIWLTYESTTAMEAWLLNKVTGLLNPSGVDAPTNWSKASYRSHQPNYKNVTEWKNAIDEYYSTKSLQMFSELSTDRAIALRNNFGMCDGLNHVRAGNFIINIIKNKHVNILINPSLEVFLRGFRWYIAVCLKKVSLKQISNKYDIKEWNYRELKDYSNKIARLQERFYEKKNLSKDKLVKISVDSINDKDNNSHM